MYGGLKTPMGKTSEGFLLSMSKKYHVALDKGLEFTKDLFQSPQSSVCCSNGPV